MSELTVQEFLNLLDFHLEQNDCSKSKQFSNHQKYIRIDLQMEEQSE